MSNERESLADFCERMLYEFRLLLLLRFGVPTEKLLAFFTEANDSECIAFDWIGVLVVGVDSATTSLQGVSGNAVDVDAFNRSLRPLANKSLETFTVDDDVAALVAVVVVCITRPAGVFSFGVASPRNNS